MVAHEIFSVRTDDGRELEVLTAGDPDGFPLLFHGGQPSAVAPYAPLSQAATERGMRLVTYSRPGYGASTPRNWPAGGPRVVDDVDDVITLLDRLDIDQLVTVGWSGGGPRALACAATLPGRCLAAATLAGAGPYDGDGLDWVAGMGEENVREYAAAAEGAEAYEAFLVDDFLPMVSVSAEDLRESLGGLLSPVDREFATTDFAEFLATSFRRAAAQGVVGVRDDGLAVVRPWGFDVAAITVPVAVWQGRQDEMVPFAHGQWLAAHVPAAEAHLFEDEGHLSLVARMPEILADLRRLADL